MNIVYEPSRTLSSRIKRRIAPYQKQNKISVKLDRPIVSFSFDDCPLSAIENGLPLLDAKGWQSTVYIACGLFDINNHFGLHMGKNDVRAVFRAGHEIGDHTFSHCDISERSLSDSLADIRKNQAELNRLDIPESETFAYPYGQVTPALKRALQTYFLGARGIKPIVHKKSVDLNQIGSMPLFNDKRFEQLLNAISSLKKTSGWMTIFTHDVTDNPSAWGCTPAQLQAVIEAVDRIDAEVMPISAAIKKLETQS